jgi:hypothetical protein
MDTRSSATSDPGYHVTNIQRMLREVADHAREDVGKVNDGRAKALFETTAETLEGLIEAYDHYAHGSEEAWR